MEKKPEDALKELQAEPLEGWTFTFWLVIHHKTTRKAGPYSAKRLSIGEKLESKIRRRVEAAIRHANRVAEYCEEQVEPDEDERLVLSARPEATDFELIAKEIGAGLDAPLVDEESELLHGYAYAIELTSPTDASKRVVAFRKLTESWSTRKGGFFDQVLWKEKRLIDLDDAKVFRIDSKFDLFHFAGHLFILSRRTFERGLNLKRGLQTKTAVFMEAAKKLELFADIEFLKEKCGGSTKRMRRICGIEKRGFYKKPEFLQALRDAAAAYTWHEVVFDPTGKLLVTEQTLDGLLTVLADRRLWSPTTHVMYNAEAASEHTGVPKG